MGKTAGLYEVTGISSIQDMLIKSAAVYGNKPAMEDLVNTPIQRLTYTELFENVLRFGRALKEMGIKEKTPIAVIGENRVQWALSYLTIMSFNYTAVPIDRNLNTNEILNIVHESDAEVIIFTNSFGQMLSERKHALKKLKYYISMDLTSKEGDFYSMYEMIQNSGADASRLPEIDPHETAEIIFTSGSLGRAKGVMLTQANLANNLMSMRKMINILPEDRFLSVLPMHHTYECTCGLLCPIYSGSSIHFARSLKTVAEDLKNVRATIVLGVPLLFEKMFKRIYKTIQEDKKKAALVPKLIKISGVIEKIGWKSVRRKIFKELHEKFGGHVRIFIAGGAAPDPNVAKGLREFGFNFIQGYGLTETSPILALNRLDNFKDDAAGLPLPGVELKIKEPDDDGIGEVIAKGPSVMKGYYKNPVVTSESFEDGWFKTGDLGYIDKDGFLHISGRKKNVIIANNGKNVFPEEVEDILNRSPYIMECLVYGEEDEKHDEIIAVQIVIDAEALIEFSEKNGRQITPELIQEVIGNEVKQANKELSSYKQVKKFYIRESEFEKTTTQKIKRYLINVESQKE